MLSVCRAIQLIPIINVFRSGVQVTTSFYHPCAVSDQPHLLTFAAKFFSKSAIYAVLLGVTSPVVSIHRESNSLRLETPKRAYSILT